MTIAEIANTRLANQHLAASSFKSARALVGWMGAVQSQDFEMSKWAIGSRVAGQMNNDIDKALEKGEIIRTHALRPTWHLVAAADVYWILQLTAKQVKAAMKFNNKALKLDDDTFTKSNKVIEKNLQGKHLTRHQLMVDLQQAGVNTEGQRLYHILLNAELDGIICSGIKSDADQTYALLEERVPKPKPLETDEALAKLASLYFNSRGPATLKDFVWWSGLPITAARYGLELIKDKLDLEMIATQTYWFNGSAVLSGKPKPSVYLLPAFDEYLLAYADRRAAIKTKHQPITFTSNGIFKPVVVVNGQVAGIWKRTIKKDTVIVSMEFFKTPGQQTLKLARKSAQKFGDFLNKELIFSAPSN